MPEPVPADSRRLYERALLLLGMLSTAALLIRAGPTHAASWEVGGVTLAYACLTRLWERGRMFLASAYVAWFYTAVARITPALGTRLWDDELYALDRRLFGTTPALACVAFATPWLTDLLSACYLAFHVYLLVAFVHALSAEYSVLTTKVSFPAWPSALTAYAVGFAGYLLVPAVGPWRALAEAFTTPLEGGPLTRFCQSVVTHGSSVYDVFPSLHLLVAAVLLEQDWRFCRQRFAVMVGPMLGMILATVYLRYHYAVDLLAGAALYILLRPFACRRSDGVLS